LVAVAAGSSFAFGFGAGVAATGAFAFGFGAAFALDKLLRAVKLI